MSDAAVFQPNPWLRIGSDDRVTLITGRSEMGQGAAGGQVLLVAEELGVPPSRIAVEFAPAAPEYANPLLGSQVTGGSTSLCGAWDQLRPAAAQARRALVEAAAALWGVDAAACRADDGAVIHAPDGRYARYGELAVAAAARPIPEPPGLTDPADYRYIGTRRPPGGVRDKLVGRCSFGADVCRPGLPTAVLARPPVPGSTLRHVATRDAEAVPGVHRVLVIEDGVAVLAEGLWAARTARNLLRPEWAPGPLADWDDAAVRRLFLEAAGSERGRVAEERGDAQAALVAARDVVEADYDTPYLAHVPLETMDCTVELGGGRCSITVPTQNQSATLETAMQVTGLPPERIAIHTPYLGGSFGRRLETDFVAEALRIAMQGGGSVHLVWSLDDELRHDRYRPANLNRLRAAVDGRGYPVAWWQHIVGPELSLGDANMPYAIPDLRIEESETDPGVPTGAWRSVAASNNAFAIESFIDELAHAAGTCPFQYRRALLADAPRHRAVLERVAEAGDWEEPLPEGCGRGIAVYHAFRSWAAHVVEVTATTDGFRVERVVCAIDCGIAIDPLGIEAQLEGAIAFGLSAALRECITLDAGAVREHDFKGYPLLRYSEMPQVEVHILEGGGTPGGVGEPGVPPLAPAVANALFSATGVRVRRLPLLPEYRRLTSCRAAPGRQVPT